MVQFCAKTPEDFLQAALQVQELNPWDRSLNS